MMCGIDEAIRLVRDAGLPDTVINRLEYHRAQAEGLKPNYHKGRYMDDFYTCRNCGFRLEIINDYCPKCGYRIRWNTTRCLTGLPLADAADKEAKDEQAGKTVGT